MSTDLILSACMGLYLKYGTPQADEASGSPQPKRVVRKHRQPIAGVTLQHARETVGSRNLISAF